MFSDALYKPPEPERFLKNAYFEYSVAKEIFSNPKFQANLKAIVDMGFGFLATNPPSCKRQLRVDL